VDHVIELACRVDISGLFVRGFSASDPRVPAGGLKKSGCGRQLSCFSVRACVIAQTVWSGRWRRSGTSY